MVPVAADRDGRLVMNRPRWTRTILTTRESCGCRKRFGLWHTIYCAGHVFGPLMARK